MSMCKCDSVWCLVEQPTFVVEEAIISENKPFSLPQPHPWAVLKVQSNTNTDGETHTLRQLKTSDGERQHFKQTSNRQFAALPLDSTISLSVKEFFQSLLSKTIHVNTLLMFSHHERPMCLCQNNWLTGWLSKRKANWAGYLAFEYSKYAFQLFRSGSDSQKYCVARLLMFRETHFPIYSYLLTKNGLKLHKLDVLVFSVLLI